MNVLLIIVALWLLGVMAVFCWKNKLFRQTWREPYFADTPVLIESDDWGPGGVVDAERLAQLLACLESHHDTGKRTAVITADVVLSVPDVEKIIADPDFTYQRKTLDEAAPDIYKVMLAGIKSGAFVPQLHGLEHLNGQAFARLCQQNDPRIADAIADPYGWNWESLASPLQGHYVDGSQLPTQAISLAQAQAIIALATQTFQRLFGYPSVSTVAPCYLWNSVIESVWQQHAIQMIQTAGYRCDGRNEHSHYHQDKPLIRVGDLSNSGQIYLVRNVMYEPVDGRNTPDTAYLEALSAYAQALPVSISTHRYNYTRSEQDFQCSLDGLDQLLTQIRSTLPDVRFVSSPELGAQMLAADSVMINHFNGELWPPLKQLTGIKKIAPFLNRLHARHPKLTLLAGVTGLIVPAWLICRQSRQKLVQGSR
jgi:hypothetical protein